MTSTMTTRRPTPRRTSASTRRFGYAVAALVNAGLLYLINVWPQWDVLPFLSEDFTTVLWLVNASVIAGIAVNLVYLVDDPIWVRKLGDILTMAVGIAAMVAVWRVFPFDFGSASIDWALVFRIGLGVAILGSAAGILANLVSLLADRRSQP